MTSKHSLNNRLLLRISFLLLIVFVAIDGILLYSFRDFGLKTAKNKAIITAELIRDALASAKEQGLIEERNEFLLPLLANKEIEAITILRGDNVNEEYGASPPDMVPQDELERAVIREGRVQEDLTEDTDTVRYRVFIPFKASSTGGVNCMDCHEAAEGEVLGAVGVTMDLTDERNTGLFTFMYTSIVFVVFLSIFLLLISRFLKKSVTRPIDEIVAGLSSSSEQFSSASRQLAAASDDLAEGTSRQAAGAEQTRGTLEQIAGLTRQNAENANTANELVDEACRLIGGGDEVMGRMVGAIQEMKEAADQSHAILRTIDEIAFQTNLLSLNASVEAARAGEAGRGFAVVAEEVGRLASRSSDAAKETNRLIESTRQKALNAEEMAGEVHANLKQIAEASEEAQSLIQRVSEASAQQSQGVSQINDAVAEMEQVSQSNAAGAEQTAATSEEINSQATGLLGIVDSLRLMISGRRQDRRPALAPPHAEETGHHLTLEISERTRY